MGGGRGRFRVRAIDTSLRKYFPLKSDYGNYKLISNSSYFSS